MARKKTDLWADQHSEALKQIAAQQFYHQAAQQWQNHNYTTAATTASVVSWADASVGAPPPEAATATDWLRGQVAEICELAAAA